MRLWSGSSSRAAGTGERGSASLEFLTAGLILLMPLVYLVVALSAIQGGALAVEGAARQAARVYVQSPDAEEAGMRAARAVEFGLADYGIEAGNASVRIDCETARTCLTRRSAVTVTVHVLVALPLVPDVLSLQDVARVPVRASATQTVSRFWVGAG
jgi:Flp pilus assembly protein TadG